MLKTQSKKRIYMDYTAATPVDSVVQKVIDSFSGEHFHNPSGLYKEGVFARKAVEEARRSIAGFISAHHDEIIFTSGATESDNLAILGIVRSKYGFVPHVITTAIEHSGVRNVCRALLDDGVITWTELPVDKSGMIDLRHLKQAMQPETVLVSVIYASNEIGVIQPIKELSKVIRGHRKDRGSKYPYLHIDATQAIQYLECNVDNLGIDLMTFNAAKIYGPKGIAALYKRRGVAMRAMMYGGGQEQGLRPGTEAVPLIVGFAKAMEIATALRISESERLVNLRDYCFRQIKSRFPFVTINGSEVERLPNNVSISVPGLQSELLVIELDARGLLCSSRSACDFDDPGESYVIKALRQGDSPAGLYNEDISSTRFTFGRKTNKKHIDKLLGWLEDVFIKYNLG